MMGRLINGVQLEDNSRLNEYQAMESNHWQPSMEKEMEMVAVKQEIDMDVATIVAGPYVYSISENLSTEDDRPISLNANDCKRILAAIKEIKLNNASILKAAEKFHIPKDSLVHYLTEFDAEISEISFLDDEDLLEIVRRIAILPITEQRFSDTELDFDEEHFQRTYRSDSSSTDNALQPISKSSDNTHSLKKILEAIRAIKLKGSSVRGTAIAFKIPKSSLLRYIRRFEAEVNDVSSLSDKEFVNIVQKITKGREIFSTEQEQLLASYVKSHIDINFKITATELRSLIYKFACNMNVIYPEDWDTNRMAEAGWSSSFRRRHSLDSLRSENSISKLKPEEKYNPPKKLLATPPLLSLTPRSLTVEKKENTNVNTFVKLLQAIKAIKMNNCSINFASQLYNVSTRNLSRYLSIFDAEAKKIFQMTDEEILDIIKRNSSYTHVPQIFSMEEEEQLLCYVKYCLYKNGKLNVSKFLTMTYEFAREKCIQYPLKWDKDKMAGKSWYKLFAVRHTSKNLVSNRNDQNYKKTLDLLRETILRKPKKPHTKQKFKRKQNVAKKHKK